MLKIDLNGIWTLKLKFDDKIIDAQVPGDISDDLQKANIIEDSYYNNNIEKIKWIHDYDYIYEKDFTVTKELLNYDYIELIFEGIDTFSTIYVNGKECRQTESMHLTYGIYVKELLKEGQNTITVFIKSINNEIKKYKNDKYVSIFNDKRIFLRKAQCHFGWDWAPDFPGCGIYRNVYISAKNKQRILNTNITTKTNGNIIFKSELSERKIDGYIVIKIAKTPDVDNKEWIETKQKINGSKNIVNVKINNPKLWWPNGYGKQNLYPYTLSLDIGGKTIDCIEGRIGIREVKLFEEPTSQNSLGFYFEVNGRKVFCRGSNWVPADCKTGCISEKKYCDLIMLAKQANINMLRVWGGGIYEHNSFYDYCDKAGIMIWQDFMFACQDIPDDDCNFVKKIVEEAEQQVKRLQNHCSIVYWCGGNEKTGAFNYHNPQYGNYFLNYVLRGICNHLDGTRPYGRISPTSYSDIDNDSESGDCHNNITDTALNHNDIKNYYKYFDRIKNNFSSECAVQGPCCLKSIRKFVPEEKINIKDKIFKNRFMSNPFTDKYPYFYDRQKHIAKELFGEINSFEDYIKKASIAHSDILTSEIDTARANKNCNGILNWMYNDIWPTGTWSIIDYYLTLKPAYYAAKRAFAPIRLLFLRESKGIKAVIINNSEKSLTGKINIYQKTYDGEIKNNTDKNINIEKDGIYELPIKWQILKGCYIEGVFKTENQEFNNSILLNGYTYLTYNPIMKFFF